MLEKQQLTLLTISELDKNYLRNNLLKEKPFKVPTKNGLTVVKSEELYELILETQSKEEIRELVLMIKIAKKRQMTIRHIFQTIAFGLI
ncbi:hypothetical protein [Niallia sp. FSL R7-0271]|uniref:hypothetical protein n=1 Tax=unclassified Niallia TaxID=2837522 RepID=UPI0030F7DCFB